MQFLGPVAIKKATIENSDVAFRRTRFGMRTSKQEVSTQVILLQRVLVQRGLIERVLCQRVFAEHVLADRFALGPRRGLCAENPKGSKGNRRHSKQSGKREFSGHFNAPSEI